MWPELTTIHQPIASMANAAVDILLRTSPSGGGRNGAARSCDAASADRTRFGRRPAPAAVAQASCSASEGDLGFVQCAQRDA